VKVNGKDGGRGKERRVERYRKDGVGQRQQYEKYCGRDMAKTVERGWWHE
jgi:hypothetical protein